jgi:hypothetical protein
MPDDIRKTDSRPGPRDTGAGDGAAYRKGYGAGGLGAGEERAGPQNSWDAPGVTPAGRRTGTSTDGTRIASGEESEPAPPGEKDRAD